ncbi:MAG: pyruvate carboxylase subunit B [Candidatus Dormibacteraeota bacterium]|uniref:Pyruvate carboxylase subunit B n=1 Tax=Candidatus Amunia macphersoniae TaxID=3127014 RepID=A0A934NFF7_9BACT|nr:pyruvate carboxylase subunit B [Candidatus Dormibacteraeota bacterium]
MPRLELVECSLRAGQQALLLSRLRSRHAVPVAGALDGCGFAALDVFGGSTFEASLRFLGEDPFATLRAIREAAPSSTLLASLGGQALAGHRQVSDDVVDAFIRVAADAGIDRFRIHDPLNDVRNLRRAMVAARQANRQVEAAIVYADSPRHDPDRIVALVEELVDIGADSICIHDPLGLLGVARVSDLVQRVAEASGLPLALSLSTQTGQADFAAYAAAVAGASRLDVALAPLAGGASVPSAEGVIAALRGTELDTGMNLDRVTEASSVLEHQLTAYSGIVDVPSLRLDSAALRGLLPPAAMGHALGELRDRDQLDRLDDVETEASRVRAELGHPPLVTPLIEIVATQAVYNVCDGDRYATVSQEVKDYCLGLYGSPPYQIDPEVRRLVNGREEPITCRPADLLEPSLASLRRELRREEVANPDDVLLVSYALFPGETLALHRGEVVPERLGDEGEPPPESPLDVSEATAAEALSDDLPVEAVPAEVRELTVEVDGQSYSVRVTGAGLRDSGPAPTTSPASPGAAAVREGTVLSPMQGLILKVAVKVGDKVGLGDVVAVLEAMKMQNDVTATRAGTISAVHVREGDVVGPRAPVVQVD